MMRLDISNALSFLGKDAMAALEPSVMKANASLESGDCAGNDFLGWLHLPSSISTEFLGEIVSCASVLRTECEAIVVAGIGGSYLGARAVLEALGDNFGWLKPSHNPRILFAGNNISEDYLAELMDYLTGKRFGVIQQNLFLIVVDLVRPALLNKGKLLLFRAFERDDLLDRVQ